MKNIFSTQWRYANIFLYVSIIISFSVFLYYHLSLGFSMSSDSERFSRWADDLIRLNFNLLEFFSLDKVSYRPSLFFFSIPVVLIALCKLIFVSEWQFAFLLLNQLLIFFSLIIFTKNLLLIGVRPIIISLSLPIILMSVDLLIWPRFILSDMIYSFLVLLSTYFIIKSIIRNKINYFGIVVVIIFLLASRPSSIPVIVAIFLFIIISKFQIFSKFKIFSKQINKLMFVLITFISIPFILSLVYLFIEYNFNDIAKVNYITGMVKEGMIIHDRPNTWVNAPSNFIDIKHIYFLRLINFFNPYASTFSVLHIALNVFQILIILSSLLIWLLITDYTKSQNKLFFFVILLSFSVASFHSFILIDYDWRYRFPIILPMLMLFPISLEIIIKKIRLIS